jgi:hypothetical protein
MPDNCLLSSAYFPPIHYISIIFRSEKVLIEKEENYLKQTYRNRCLILTSDGPSALSVPVMEGSSRKTPVKEIKIDYSKRWQQVHMRALISSYRSSAFFEYYFEDFEKIILGKSEYLLDLNSLALSTILRIINIPTPVEFTEVFEKDTGQDYDLRYRISPKKDKPGTTPEKEYYQVFGNKFGFIPGLSILDLIFNTGFDAVNYL